MKRGEKANQSFSFFSSTPKSWRHYTSFPLLSPFSRNLPPALLVSLDTMRAAALAPSPRSAAALSSAPRRASAVAPLAAKPTKAADFRGLSNEEIDKAVAESKRALFDMRIAQKTRQVRRRWSRGSLKGSHEARERASGAIRKATSRAVNVAAVFLFSVKNIDG